MKSLLALCLLLFACYETIDSMSIIKDSVALLPSTTILPSLITDNSLRQVMPLNRETIILESGKAIPFTDVRAALSTAEFESGIAAMMSEEGVGVPLAKERAKEKSQEKEKKNESSGKPNGEALRGNKIEFSDNYPIYAKPPANFKPIIYPTHRVDNAFYIRENKISLAPPAKPYPNRATNGLSAWLLGGVNGLEQSHFWRKTDNKNPMIKPDKLPIEIIAWQEKPTQRTSSSSPIELITPTSVIFPLTRTRPSLNTRNPFDFNAWSEKDTPSAKPPTAPLFIENIEFIPLTKQTLNSPRLTPNFEFKSNFLKDLMTSDGGTSDPIFIDYTKQSKRLAKDLNSVTLILRSEPDQINFIEKSF